MSTLTSFSRASIDTLAEVDDCSPATLIAAATRVAASVRQEHFVYREAEMDELWRLVDMDLTQARRRSPGSPEVVRLERIHALIHKAHDVLGQDENTVLAASLL